MTEQYLPEELEKAVDLLEAWAWCRLSPPDKHYGICYNLDLDSDFSFLGWGVLIAEAAKTWPEFSGHSRFPVSHPHLPSETAYRAKWKVAKWSGEYGAARRRLCQHVADWIRTNPAEALRILHWR